MSSQAFKELARTHISNRDAALMDLVTLEPRTTRKKSGSRFIDRWWEWEWVLRLNLAKARFAKLKREGTAPVEPPAYLHEITTVAARAVAVTESPLEGEIILNKARWETIDSLQGLVYFSSNTIFAYLLKLLILERHAVFQQTETGFSEYKSLYASILESAQSGVSSAGVSQ
jgi:hypothetical protein